jgi:NADPH2:quinone reductase
MQAIRVHEFGGPEVMRLEELPTPEPGPGQVLARVDVAGVNFVDLYQRSGTYKLPLPWPLGREGAGRVEAVGTGVADLKVGDRVAWGTVAGSYATHVLAPADRVAKLPDSVSAQQAAAVMLQGMTAHYLCHTTFPLKPGTTCLIHAAAGGVGLLLVQMAKQLGARVIGTVSTEEKARLAREAGADEVILYTQQNFEEEVKRLTDGKRLPVVYDSVGKDTFDQSLRCLAPRGYLVLFGHSSGVVPPFDILRLMSGGSLFLTRPSLDHHTLTTEEFRQRAGEVLEWVGSGRLRVRIDRTYPLAEAAEAHRALAGRGTSGKVLLEVQA